MGPCVFYNGGYSDVKEFWCSVPQGRCRGQIA